MASDDDGRLPAGRQVYDSYNGSRVGSLVGALLGAVLMAVTGATIWTMVALAVLGGMIGFVWERRRIQDELDDEPPGS